MELFEAPGKLHTPLLRVTFVQRDVAGCPMLLCRHIEDLRTQTVVPKQYLFVYPNGSFLGHDGIGISSNSFGLSSLGRT